MDTVFTLDWKGVVLAVALALALFFLGGGLGAEGLLFVSAMLFFLIASAIATRFKKSKKASLGVYEHARGWKNVAANGLVPLFIAVLYFASTSSGSTNTTLFLVAFMASVAGITADKFSSEIGVLDKNAYMLVDMNRVKPGVSGAVSLLGLSVGFLASGCIALLGFVFGVSAGLCLLIAVAGFLGDVVDSIFGYFEDRGIGNKYTTNIACAATGALVVLVVLWLLYLSYRI